jgi:Bacterial Ig-like domain (group 2)
MPRTWREGTDATMRRRLAIVALGVSACSGGDGTAAPAAPVLSGITVTLSEPAIHVGRTATASVAGRDQFGGPLPVSAPTWAISPSTVATISASGAITGTAAGQATVTATVGQLSASATLTVTNPPPVLTTLAIALPSSTIVVGQQVTAAVAGRDQYGGSISIGAVSWASSAPSVATVTSAGVVTGVAPGQSTLSVSSAGLSASVVVTIVPPPPVLTTLSVTLAVSTIASGQSTQATAAGRDQFGAPFDPGAVTWSVGSPSVASINGAGVITGIGTGTTSVFARTGAVQGSATITVTSGAASRLIIVRVPAGIVSGLPFATQPVVTIADSVGNTVTNSTGIPVTMTVAGGAGTVGSTTRSTANGVASFSDVGIVGNPGTSHTITFSSGALRSASTVLSIAPATFGNGTRRVGIEIPAGLFRSRNSPTTSCYWARLSGFGGTSAEIIANDIGSGPRLVSIASTDRGFESSGCATWTQVTGPITSSPTAPFDDGMYMVGSEIAPGTWRADGTGTSCYWARLRGFGGTLAEIIANSFGPLPAIVTILPADVGFASTRCGTWTKIG